MYKIEYVKDGYVSLFNNETQLMIIERVVYDDSYNVVFKNEAGNDMDVQKVNTFEAAAQLIIDEINSYFIQLQKKTV